MYRISLAGFVLLLLSACVIVQEGGTKNEKASKINVQLGIGYYHRGNLESANEKLVKALDQDPKSSQAHHAYAVLQNRFQDKEKTEFHFRKAIEFDSGNSEALSNFGAFLCSDGRYMEAEKMFLQAVENPLYRTPEVAYTSAAVCILKEGDTQRLKAKGYLKKALAIGSHYRPALINMAEIVFAEKDTELTRVYLDRYHLVGDATERSLWLSIQNELALGNTEKAIEYAETLKTNFPHSTEYENWQELQND
jgi:type IV pilus assembly protein PilF